MAMILEKVVPFGRSLDEYKRMFALADGDLDKRIVGAADGPASFNAEMSALGKAVVSVDPLYVHGAAAIERQFHAVIDDIIAQLRDTADDWVWTYHRSPEHLRENRVRALRRFLDDYAKGRSEGRYVVGGLPRLEFPDNTFELALCSHFLFLYSDHLSYEFHLTAVRELLRVAAEVRIFPLLTLMRRVSPYVAPLIEGLAAEGFAARVERVGYELQRGGNEMLCIRRRD